MSGYFEPLQMPEVSFSSMSITHDGNSQSIIIDCTKGGILTKLIISLVAFSLTRETIGINHLSPIVDILTAVNC